METLKQGNIEKADLFIAATGSDEVNLLSAITAKGINPKVHTIARIRNPEYIDQAYVMRNVFGLSMTFNPEKQAAREIERLLKLPGFLKRDSFAKGKVEIVELRIDEKSKLKGVPLSTMYKTVKCKVLVCAVVRDGEAFTPSGNSTLRAGDRIFVTAPTDDLAKLLKNIKVTADTVTPLSQRRKGSKYATMTIKLEYVQTEGKKKNGSRSKLSIGDYQQTSVSLWPPVDRIISIFDAVIGVTSSGEYFVDGFCPCSEEDIQKIIK
jgi:Trk K+ transport system NAD-binding subunit